MYDTSFVDELASSAPTPGGGGASAYAGALAAALASMVGELTVGKSRYAEVEEYIIGSLGRLSVLRARLFELVDADAEAFKPLARAWRMPKGTAAEAAAKDDAIQAALVPACEIPLDIMRACVDVLCECELMVQYGSRLAVSDAGACAAIARGALVAASMNVWVNIASLSDEQTATSFRMQTQTLLAEGKDKATSLIEAVCAELGVDENGGGDCCGTLA